MLIMLKPCSRRSVCDAATELTRCCLLGVTALLMVNLLHRESAVAKCRFLCLFEQNSLRGLLCSQLRAVLMSEI